MAAANKDVCFACGEAVPRASERRNLTSSSSIHVLNLWKAVLQSELERRESAERFRDIIAGTGAMHMCRKCFYSYEKVLNARAAIESNFSNAFGSLFGALNDPTDATQECSSQDVPQCPPPKRRSHGSKTLTSNPVSEKSPEVSVRYKTLSQ